MLLNVFASASRNVGTPGASFDRGFEKGQRFLVSFPGLFMPGLAAQVGAEAEPGKPEAEAIIHGRYSHLPIGL